MDEFEQYLSSRSTASQAPTPVQREMADYNAQIGGTSDDEFSGYLKERGGLTPARKAILEAKLAAHGATGKYASGAGAELTEAPGLAGDIASRPGEYARDAFRGAMAGLSKVADYRTLGAYKRIRDPILNRLDPESAKNIQQSEAEVDQPISFSEHPIMRAAQLAGKAGAIGLGYGGGAAGMFGNVAKGAAERVGAGAFGQGAIAGGLTSGTQSAVEGNDLKTVAKDTGLGAVGGGAIGGALSGIGKFLKGAPQRAANAEVAGLIEDVGQRSRNAKFIPKEQEIRAELSANKEISRRILSDPRAALPAAEKQLQNVAENQLNPYYEEMKQFGVDGVNYKRVVNNLIHVREGFTENAEASQRAVVDNLINSLTNKAAQNGGRLPAEFLREEATAYQKQGFANLPSFGSPIQLSKQAKQGIGGALREAIADHVGTVYSNGNAANEFRAASRRVSAWYAIKDLMEEKVKRMNTDSPTLMKVVGGLKNMVNHFPLSMLPHAGPLARAIDSEAIAPMVESPEVRQIASQAASGAPVIAGQLGQAALDKRRKEQEAAAAFQYQE